MHVSATRVTLLMKKTTTLLLAFLFIVLSVSTVNAQATESIWLTADANAYKTDEVVLVRVNSASATPIQGFTFQIRYDPNCLKPMNAVSPIAGMNGLQLPQNAGLVDASFASTKPQSAIGVLSEISFRALGGCSTELYLESAALAIRNEAGFAAPLEGITLLERTILLNIANTIGGSETPALADAGGDALLLDPSDATTRHQAPDWGAVFGIALFTLVVMTVLGVIIFTYLRSARSA
jgi:hypothetical protein